MVSRRASCGSDYAGSVSDDVGRAAEPLSAGAKRSLDVNGAPTEQ